MSIENYKLLIRNLRKNVNEELDIQKVNDSVGAGAKSNSTNLRQKDKRNNRR